MAIESLQQLGAVFLSPTLTFFNQQLCKQQLDQPLFFLAREGYWLEKSFSAYSEIRGCASQARYMLVSRAFLFKLGLLHPKTYDYSLNFTFSGELYELMRTRFMLSDVSIKRVFTEKEQRKKWLLPQDLNKLAVLLKQKIPALTPIISPSSDAYRDYLQGLGFFDFDTIHLVDIGYSGTIQTLLTLMFKKNTHGHYLIASKPGQHKIGEQTATMTGYLKEGVKLGQGYLPLDRSMFLEALLTAPVGQFQDIRHNPLPDRDFDFYYGRKVTTQHNFHLVQEIANGAIQQVKQYAQNQVSFRVEDVEQIYTQFVTKKGMLPRHSWPLFTIDDDISSEGTVNGLDFFGLKL